MISLYLAVFRFLCLIGKGATGDQGKISLHGFVGRLIDWIFILVEIYNSCFVVHCLVV